MIKWEYHVEREVDFSPFWEQTQLKLLGDQGWELMVNVPYTFCGIPKYTLIFKRKKKA